MIIRCPNCSTTYKVDGGVLDAPKPSFRCSRCKHVFRVQVSLKPDTTDADRLVSATDPASTRHAPDTDAASHAPAADPQVAEDADSHGAPQAQSDDDNAVAEVRVEEVRVEDMEDKAETPPAPAGSPEGNAEESDADGVPHNPELPHLEFDPNPAGVRLPDEAGLLAFQKDHGQDDADAEPQRPPPDFTIDDDFLIPPKREAPPLPLPDAKGSVVPFVSLIALILFAAGLVTLIHMTHPEPLDNLLRRVPWYGAAVFDNRHYKSTLVFQSLVSGVRPILNQTEVFVVSGKLLNRNDQSVRQVQIEAQLFDEGGKQVGREVTFVGNAISARIIEDMSFREISLLQSLKPQSAYHIPPQGSADFTIVFPKPKAAVATFSCRVLTADGAA